jgi:hypothetical protein
MIRAAIVGPGRRGRSLAAAAGNRAAHPGTRAGAATGSGLPRRNRPLMALRNLPVAAK